MVMRVSTLQQFNNGVNGILNNQATVNRTQQQISSGRRVLTPADDPVAATRILQLQQDVALREQYEKNLIAGRNHLNLEEATLVSVKENLQRVRELTVQAGNGSMTADDRSFIAAEIEERLAALVDLLNTKNASNVYIFSGFKGETIPFQERPGGGYTFQGDEGQRELQISAGAKVKTNDSGETLFVDIPSVKNTFFTYDNPENQGSAFINVGYVADQDEFDSLYPEDFYIEFNADSAVTPPRENYTIRRRSDDRPVDGLSNINYAPGSEIRFAGVAVKVTGNPEPGDTFFVQSSEKQSLTDTISMLVEGLNAFPDTPAGAEQAAELVAISLDNIDATLTTVSTVRSEIGARLNSIDSIDNFQQDLELVSQEILSTLQDLDFAEAVSRLSLESFLLEASQQSYTRISNLSLFNQL